MSIRFCHIAPVSYLDKVSHYDTHLLLAHLIEENEAYRNFYIELKQNRPNVFYHLDNSAFEMFKRGEPMYPAEKLIDMAKLVNADSIVMTDYPKEPFLKTVQSAVKLIPEIKEAGFKTFYCPQSELGNIDDLLGSFEWAIFNRNIDFIGVSILACPIGLGVNESKHDGSERDDSYRMQRFLSRWRVMDLLKKHGLLRKETHKRLHCLGLTDGPNEIDLLKQYQDHIFSWDSSSAIWHGIYSIKYDGSPTGLRRGKLETEVDFNVEYKTRPEIDYNMAQIDRMCY